MCDVVIVPADMREPLRQQKLRDDSLKELQVLVGGYIEHVRIGNTITLEAFEDIGMYVNEDGIMQRLPYNSRASLLYGEAHHGQCIYGDAVLVGERSDPEEGRVTATLPANRKVEFWVSHIEEGLK